MRSDAGFIQALRAPLAVNLTALRNLLRQNQLQRLTMADMRARRDVAPAGLWPAVRAPRLTGVLLLAGLFAAGGLAVLALFAGGTAEFAMLGVLALLAVAGAFLVFGLLSGYLRLSERVAEAEMVKSITDGLDSGLEIVNQQGGVLYRNRALQRLTGRGMGRRATLEELFAGEPEFGARLLPSEPCGRARRDAGRGIPPALAARQRP